MRIRKLGEPWLIYLWSIALDALEAFNHEVDAGSRAPLEQVEKAEDLDDA